MAKARRKPKKPGPLPWNGDHGTGTPLALADSDLEPLEEDGKNPNRMARRRRKDRLNDYKLSMRQEQAGKAIRDAWCRAEMNSSGGPLKEQVDSSPKPDSTITAQVEAQSRLVFVMGAVPSAMRDVVEHVCWHNRKMSDLKNGRLIETNRANLKVALDLVANRLKY